MRTRLTAAVATLGSTCVLAASASHAGFAPRDLQGYWANGTATPLVRPAELKDRFRLTPPEAAEFTRGGLARVISSAAPEDQLGADLNDLYAETNSLTMADGGRTSLIVDPPDGQLPATLPAAQTRAAARPKHSYDDPESLTLDERCLGGTTGGTSQIAPPITPNWFGLNYYRFVQTADTLAISTEIAHDTRVIRIGGTHAPSTIRTWFGDSVAHWENDTLVVDTTNFNGKIHFRNSGERLHVVERFTRADRNSIRYRATVEDPDTWARPWTMEYSFTASNRPLVEYACHEGNYSLSLALSGHRAEERRKP